MAQREGSRTPHEGTIEFISLDSHKGAGESVSDTSQQSSARAVTVAVLSGARAPCWHFCCFPGMHLEASSYLGSFLLPLPELLCWDLPCHSATAARGAGMFLLHLEPWLLRACEE